MWCILSAIAKEFLSTALTAPYFQTYDLKILPENKVSSIEYAIIGFNPLPQSILPISERTFF
jgi:hypothetical protein